MGKNIKIELELPEFEKDLTISVKLHKDGGAPEVTSSSDATGYKETPVWKQSPAPAPVEQTMTGNMMDMKF